MHRLVRGLRPSAVVAPLDDRPPVGGASSYRAAEAVASVFSRPASGNPNRASHRRDDSVPRSEPHVLRVRVAFALKGLDIPAQGKATRVVRASPSPWVAYHCGEKALKGRDNRCIGLCRPFRAWEPIATTIPGRRYTLPRADFSRPLQGTPPRPRRFPNAGLMNRSNPERPAQRANSAMKKAAAHRSGRSQRRRGGKNGPTEFSAFRGGAHERASDRQSEPTWRSSASEKLRGTEATPDQSPCGRPPTKNRTTSNSELAGLVQRPASPGSDK